MIVQTVVPFRAAAPSADADRRLVLVQEYGFFARSGRPGRQSAL